MDDDETTLRAGTQVELPFWMAAIMCTKDLIELEMPMAYSHTARKRLSADPDAVDLNAIAEFFFECGMKVATLSVVKGDITRSVYTVAACEC